MIFNTVRGEIAASLFCALGDEQAVLERPYVGACDLTYGDVLAVQTESDEAGEVLPPLSLGLRGRLAFLHPPFEYLAAPGRSVVLDNGEVAPTNVVR
jgi:hypothetical protein